MQVSSQFAFRQVRYQPVAPATPKAKLVPAAPTSGPAPARTSLPSFASAVDPKSEPIFGQEELYKASDAWVKDQAQLSRPEELTAFQGLGRWVAWKDLLEVHPEHSSRVAADQTIKLWDDEYSYATSAIEPADGKPNRVGFAITKSLMVLRMMDSYLGKGLVDKTVRETLERSTAEPQGLETFYAVLAEKAGSDLPPWSQAKAWFHDNGHPLVASSLVQKDDKTLLRLDQSVFSVYKDEPIENPGSTWPIPLAIKYKDEEGIKVFRTVFDQGSALLELPAKGKVAWAYPNGGGLGVFRTRMSPQEMKAIEGDLPHLSPAEQGALACNQWRLVRHGVADVGEYYDQVVAGHPNLDDGLMLIHDIELSTHSNYVRPKDREAFNKFYADMLAPLALQGEGLNPSPDSDAAVRGRALQAVSVMAAAGNPKALRVAQSWAEQYKATGTTPLGAFSHILSGDPEVLATLSAKAKDPSMPLEQRLSTLAELCFWPNPKGAAVAFELLNDSESGLQDTDRDRLRTYLTYGPHGRDLLFASFQADPSLVETHKDLVKKTYTFPCYRDELSQLIERPEISPTVREELKDHFNKGHNATLAHLSDSIHNWLVKAGYQNDESHTQNWILL